MQLLIMGFAVTNEVKRVKLYIEDRDGSFLSHQLSESFTTTDRFRLISNPKSLPAAELIQDWQAQVVIIIPPDFGRDLSLNRKPVVQINTDGIDGNSAAVAITYAQGIITGFVSDFTTRQAERFAVLRTATSSPPLIAVEDRLWYNPDLNSTQYMVPGIIAILLTITSMMLAAMSLVKEKEIGTLEQLLVTPVTKTELLLGKLIPYWLISMFEIVFITVVAHFVMHLQFAGSVWQMLLMAAIFLLTTLGLGIFVSTQSSTQQQAMFMAWFMMVFMLLLSGLFVPIQNMPLSIRRLVLINPMSYFMTITREIVVKGNNLLYLWREALALLAYGIGIFSFSVARFHKVTK
jgi:ABC-2 type transport system permease protein